MPFKVEWESPKTQSLPQETLLNMVRFACPHKNLASYSILSGGCANINVQVFFEEDEHPLILRIYLRDKTAPYREQALGIFLKHVVPVPQVYSVHEQEPYVFALTQFMPGILLRDFLRMHPSSIGEMMYDVGLSLSKLSSFTFDQSGFLGPDLKVLNSPKREDYLTFAESCFQTNLVNAQLSSSTVARIREGLKKYAHLLPEKEAQLVHGDFNPANILVASHNKTWKISGILDWEFSFSGLRLWDIANMLRYSHKMPSIFKTHFLGGLQQNGVFLPEGWEMTIHLLNLLSLLDLLQRSDPRDQPQQGADICELIDHSLSQLE